MATLHIPNTARISYPYDSFSNQRWLPGTTMDSADGREWVFCLNGAVATVAGSIYQSAVPDAAYDDIVVAATAVGERDITVTTGATALTLNQLAGGYMIVADDAGEGRTYVIASNPAVATTTAGVITLASGLEVALTAASTVTLVVSPYSGVIIHPSPPTALVVGVAMSAVAAGEYGWFQTKGVGSVLSDGTLVINERFIASTSVNGAAAVIALTEAAPNTGAGQYTLGSVIEVGADTEYSVVRLDIS